MMMKKRQALVTFCCNLSFCAFLPLKSTEKNAHKHKLSSAKMGHTIWIRANSLFTFASTALALVAVLASITDIWHTAEPDVFLRVKSVERFRPVSPNAHRKKANSNNEVNDEASLNFQLRLDLRPLFSWLSLIHI